MKLIDAIPLFMKRVFIIGMLLAVVGFIGVGVIAKLNTEDPPPAAAEAPWAIQTTSRIYYAKEFKLSGQTPEIRGYWTLEGKRYKYKEEIKDFDQDIWGNVVVIRRAK